MPILPITITQIMLTSLIKDTQKRSSLSIYTIQGVSTYIEKNNTTTSLKPKSMKVLTKKEKVSKSWLKTMN